MVGVKGGARGSKPKKRFPVRPVGKLKNAKRIVNNTEELIRAQITDSKRIQRTGGPQMHCLPLGLVGELSMAKRRQHGHGGCLRPMAKRRSFTPHPIRCRGSDNRLMGGHDGENPWSCLLNLARPAKRGPSRTPLRAANKEWRGKR